MRYTRYNYKKKNKNNIGKFILSFSVMSVFVIIVGVLLANVIIYFLPINDAGSKIPSNKVLDEPVDTGEELDSNDGVPTSSDVNTDANAAVNQSKEGQGTINTEFVAIQCGYFANGDKANEALSKVSGDYGGFIFNDADKFRVLVGVYTADQGQSVIENLNTHGIENAKVSFSLNGTDEIQRQIAGICNGYLNILSTAFNDDVKAFNTDDFKSWVTNLDVIEEGQYIEVLKEIKNHINEIPVEIKKENVSAEMQYVYKVLLNFQK